VVTVQIEYDRTRYESTAVAAIRNVGKRVDSCGGWDAGYMESTSMDEIGRSFGDRSLAAGPVAQAIPK